MDHVFAESGLVAQLHLGETELVSFVGAGGKTTLLFALGRQLRAAYPASSVLLSSTTHMAADRTENVEVLVAPDDDDLAAELRRSGMVLAWRSCGADKATGVSPETVDRWRRLAPYVLVEADGARRREFKAPASHEPVIPGRTTVTVVVVGAGALGEPIADRCHRPELVATLAGCDTSDELTPTRAATVVVSCYLRRLPSTSRAVLVVNAVQPAQRPIVEEFVDLTADHFETVACLPWSDAA